FQAFLDAISDRFRAFLDTILDCFWAFLDTISNWFWTCWMPFQTGSGPRSLLFFVGPEY
ncbi:unnamed protein product, partial [Rhizophagus irregularis]